jgi:hypothetical protein
MPSREEQIAVLNRALSDEVLRHARTRLELARLRGEWSSVEDATNV